MSLEVGFRDESPFSSSLSALSSQFKTRAVNLLLQPSNSLISLLVLMDLQPLEP